MQRWILLLLAAIPPTPSRASESFILADNNQVASTWAQAAPAAPVPEVVAESGGATRIEWKGGASLDFHHNKASGGNTLNPYRSGDFFQLQAQGDLRKIAPDGSQSWLQFMATQSNERALQRVSTLVGLAQAGKSGPDYQVAVGDVAPNFSALGTYLGVRGLLGQKLAGDTLISATAGTLTPLWNDLWDHDERTQLLRHVVAAKVDTRLGATTRGFLTLQSYTDDRDSYDGILSYLMATRGHTGTVGLTHQQGRLALQGELGFSRWKQDSQPGENDWAFVIDGTWGGDTYNLQAGHHDLGLYYTSLSSQAAAGIRETYLGGNWQATGWLVLQGDLRRSRNELASGNGAANALTTDSAALSEIVTFGADWSGLTLSLSQSVSSGENPASGDSSNKAHAVMLGYAQQHWNGAIGFNQTWLSNDANAALDGRTDAVTLQLGRSFMDTPDNPTWNVSLQGSVGYQSQKLDAGGDNQTLQYGLGVGANRAGWGTLNATVTLGYVDPATGDDLRNYGYALDATHPFKGDSGAFKLYARDNHTFKGNPLLVNRTRTVGAQLSLAF